VRRLAFVVFLTACTKPPPQATAIDAQRANVALADLNEGRTLLIKKCGGCHRTPLPHEYRAAEWPKHVSEMAERSKIDDKQRSLIERYLVVMADAQR
jgi:cytochrome c5